MTISKLPFEVFLLDRGDCAKCPPVAVLISAPLSPCEIPTKPPHRSVVVLGRHGDLTAIETICLDENHQALVDASNELGRAMSGREQAMSPERMSEFSQKLLEFLLPGTLAKLYHRIEPSALTLQVLSDRPEITAIAWEYMALSEPAPPPHPERIVVRVHRSASRRSVPALPRSEKLRVLFAMASPARGYVPIAPEVALQCFADKFMGNVLTRTNDSPIELTVLNECSIEALTQKLTATESSFDIFHFFGHGDYNEGGRLIFQTPQDSEPQPVGALDLASTLAGKGIRLVILSACWTSKNDPAMPFASVTNALLDAGLPAVVANQFEIDANTIPAFIAGLYNSLFAYGDIDRAFGEARCALKQAEKRVSMRAPIIWGVPTLHRLPDGRQLFGNPT